MVSSIPPARSHAVQGDISAPVITFDAGQTLVELDLDFLRKRLAERDVPISVDALAAAAPAAWCRYDELIAAAAHRGAHPWHDLMRTLLTGAGIASPEPLVQWLWTEQPRANLWRRPIADMVALARELAGAGFIVGVLSNSEGRIAELLAEVGIADPFTAVVDSGRIGIEKPDPRIFAHALAALGGEAGIHIGDSWAADVAGARGAGWRAIWYGRGAKSVDDDGVAAAHDAAEARAALARFGVQCG